MANAEWRNTVTEHSDNAPPDEQRCIEDAIAAGINPNTPEMIVHFPVATGTPTAHMVMATVRLLTDAEIEEAEQANTQFPSPLWFGGNAYRVTFESPAPITE